MSDEALIAGFYLYGAVTVLIIGLGAVMWHDRIAFAAVVLGACAIAVVYMMMLLDEVRKKPPKWLYAAAVLGWVLPALAAVLLVVAG